MQSNTIYVVGSLNVDLVTRTERLPRAGETVRGGDLMLIPGGKGANQVCAAAKLGGQARMIGQVGGDAFADLLLDSLRIAGADTSGVGRSDGATGSATICVMPNGENAIVISPGANARLTPALALSRLSDLARGDLLLVQLETPLDTVEAVLAYAASRGAISILDPAPAQPLSRELLAHVAYLTPNQSEAALLLGEVGPEMDLNQASLIAQRVIALGPKSAVLKLGAMGCFLSDNGFQTTMPGFTVDAIDTTAAGDTFNGALAVGLAEGMPVAVAAHFANAAAALSVTRMGAQSSIPTRDEVDAFLTRSGRPLEEVNHVCS
jgi:ribokinase